MPKGHKDNCLCIVCQQRRRKVVAATVVVSAPTPTIVAPPPSPTEVRLDELNPTAKFELGGEKYLVKEQVEGMVVCCNLFNNNVMTLAGFTMVKPIK